VGHL